MVSNDVGPKKQEVTVLHFRTYHSFFEFEAFKSESTLRKT